MHHNDMFDFVELRFDDPHDGYTIVVQLDRETVKRVHSIATDGVGEYYSHPLEIRETDLHWQWAKPTAIFECSAFADGIEFQLDYIELSCDPMGHISLRAKARKLPHGYLGFLPESGTGTVGSSYAALGLKEPKFFHLRDN